MMGLEQADLRFWLTIAEIEAGKGKALH
jgi:hypothetical protein